LTQADLAKAAARSAAYNSRPRVAVKRQLRDRLLLNTFQRFEVVSRGLAMAGRPRNWDAIGQRLPRQMISAEIKERLNNIVTRRNQIVHEGDCRRLERPRNNLRNTLTLNEARADINFIAELIEAIHALP
jgi:hypothetical protein